MTRPEVSNPHRVTVHNHVVAALAAAVLAVGAAVSSSATAAADPPPPPPPAPADAAPAPTGFLPPAGTLQSFLPEGGMAPGSGYDFLLGQAPMPTASGGQPTPVTVGADGQPVAAAQSPTFLDLRQFKPLSQPISRWRDRVSNRSTATRPPLQTRRHLASLKTPRGRTASGIIRWAAGPRSARSAASGYRTATGHEHSAGSR